MAVVLLNNVAATGAGGGWQCGGGIESHTVQATITGAPTAVTVDLEGSVDGSTWVALDTHAFSAGELTATKAMWHIVNKVVKHVRANLTTLTGGTSPTVTAKWEGNKGVA